MLQSRSNRIDQSKWPFGSVSHAFKKRGAKGSTWIRGASTRRHNSQVIRNWPIKHWQVPYTSLQVQWWQMWDVSQTADREWYHGMFPDHV